MKNVKESLTHRQRQALVTQQLIVAAATALFVEQGYGVTTIEAISARAGVAVSTIYSIYKSKRGILKAIRESWHQESGQRDIYQAARGESNPQRRFELAARATRRQWETSTTMAAIYNSAAAVDADAAAELKAALTGRQTTLASFIRDSAPMLRPGLDPERAVAIYLALTQHEVYRQLVDVFGWSPNDYEIWLSDLLKQQLLANPTSP